jgi:excisionase family DNA binding protein
MPKRVPDHDALLTPREVAEVFGVRTTTIARWAREGTLPASLTPGGHRRYRREDVRQLLDAQEQSTPLDEAARPLAEDAARLYDQGWSAT